MRRLTSSIQSIWGTFLYPISSSLSLLLNSYSLSYNPSPCIIKEPISQFPSLLSVCFSCSVMPNSLRPHGLQPTRLLCPWGFSKQEYWNGLPCPLSGHLPNPGIKPRSYCITDSLPTEPEGKPKNTGMGSLTLLWGNLPDPGIKLGSPTLQENSLPAELPGKPKSIYHSKT